MSVRHGADAGEDTSHCQQTLCIETHALESNSAFSSSIKSWDENIKALHKFNYQEQNESHSLSLGANGKTKQAGLNEQSKPTESSISWLMQETGFLGAFMPWPMTPHNHYQSKSCQ